MKALRLPTPHPGRFWFATGFRAALRGSCSPKRSRADGGAARAWAVWSAGGPVPAGVRVDGVGSHRFPGDPSRAFALLQDPGRISGPSPKRSHRCCPRAQHGEGFSGHMISRLPQGFTTRCLRFACDVAAARARLASGWLVGLCRERGELSGSRRKVSERSHVILLSRAYPVASWVHAERLVHQLIPATRGQAQAIETTRQLIWWFYRDLKVWKTAPCPRRARALRARFARIFTRRTGFVMLDRLLARLHRRKAELLRVSCPRFLWTPYCPEKLEDDSVEGNGKTMIDAAGLVGSEGERSSSMLSITGQAAGAGPLAPGQRWSLARKHEVVLRLLRGGGGGGGGGPVEAVPRQCDVPVWQLERWRARALAGLKTGLRARAEDPAARELAEAHRRIGELSMEVELLRARIERPGPLARRRPR